MRLGNPLNCSLNDITVHDFNRTINMFHAGNSSENASSADEAHADNRSGEVTNGCGSLKSQTANETVQYGKSLSLTIIQTLVSMTIPRNDFRLGMIGNPSFIEFDLSVDGFGCLFLPSVFPLSIDRTVTTGGQTTTVKTTTGTGGGGARPFPPSNGLTFSSWIFFSKCVINAPAV